MSIARLISQACEQGFSWQLTFQDGIFTINTMFPTTRSRGRDLALVITRTLADIDNLNTLES